MEADYKDSPVIKKVAESIQVSGVDVIDMSMMSMFVKRNLIMPANGELSEKFGVYKTLCCDAEIVIGVGVAFPACPNHANVTTHWTELPDADPSTYELECEKNS